MMANAPGRGRDPFVQLLFGPFANLKGLLTLVMITATCGGVLLILFLNATYAELFEERLRGLYPPLFWEGLYLEDLTRPPGELGSAQEEKFAKNRRITLGRDGDQRFSTIFANVRAVDYREPEVLRHIGHLIGAAPGPGEVFLSGALHETLFPDAAAPGGRGAKLRFPSVDGSVTLRVGGVFELLNRERWIVFHGATLAELDLGGETGSILAVYPPTSAAAWRTGVGELAPGRRLFTWDERLPFFHRCLWDIASGGIAVFGAAIATMLVFYLVNVLGTALVEVRKNLFLLRLFGGSPAKAAFAALAGWAAVLLVVAFGGGGAISGMFGIFGSETYRLTGAAFHAYLRHTLSDAPAAAAFAVAVLALPSAAVWQMMKRKRVARLWE